MTDLEIHLYCALKRISMYQSPERLKKNSWKMCGLSPEETIEMAYENVRDDAKEAIKGIRITKSIKEGSAS